MVHLLEMNMPQINYSCNKYYAYYNAAENAIRPFVVGRKNWLFSGHPNGASASSCLYSLIETAKACGLKPYDYLRHLFDTIPFAETETDYEKLLPQNLTQEEIEIYTHRCS